MYVYLEGRGTLDEWVVARHYLRYLIGAKERPEPECIAAVRFGPKARFPYRTASHRTTHPSCHAMGYAMPCHAMLSTVPMLCHGGAPCAPAMRCAVYLSCMV